MINRAILACETQDFASLLCYLRMIKWCFPLLLLMGCGYSISGKRSERYTYSE